MPTTVQSIQMLPDLKADSGKRLPTHIIIGMTSRSSYQLVRTSNNPSGPGVVTTPKRDLSSLLQNPHAEQKLMTIPPGGETGFTAMLNTALLGGESYPILSAVAGTVAGAISGGAGLLFTIGTTALDASRTTQRVLARPGDELWLVEEVGKRRNGNAYSVVHIGSYFLVDPYRRQSTVQGWLIHESRTEIRV